LPPREAADSVPVMVTREELEALSSKDLHDKATSIARHRVDVGFFWRLLKAIPAAEASVGDVEDADMNIASSEHALSEYLEADEGDLADALRPMYLDYILEHGK
jgi:hypothetical protein